MTTVGEYPIGGSTGNQDMHYPVGINPFKGLSQIGQEDAVRMHGVVKEVLYVQVIKLRLPEKVEKGLSRVEGAQ